MPFDLSLAAKKRVPLTITIDDQELVVEFNPRAITPRTQAELVDLPAHEIHKLVTLLVVSWDMTLAGKPVPLKPEALVDVPTELLETVVLRVMEAMRPNSPTTATPSGSFS